MLSLIFSRAKKRNLIGLLALGEWGPPTGAPVAVTGTVASQQAGQQTLCDGSVSSGIVFGGGRFLHIEHKHEAEVPAISGVVRARQQSQNSAVVGDQIFDVEVLGTQSEQNSEARGETIPAIRGACDTEQSKQRSTLQAAQEVVGRALSDQQVPSTAAAGALEISGAVGTNQGVSQSQLESCLQFIGAVASSQPAQDDMLLAEMVDTELEMFAAIIMQAA